MYKMRKYKKNMYKIHKYSIGEVPNQNVWYILEKKIVYGYQNDIQGRVFPVLGFFVNYDKSSLRFYDAPLCQCSFSPLPECHNIHSKCWGENLTSPKLPQRPSPPRPTARARPRRRTCFHTSVFHSK